MTMPLAATWGWQKESDDGPFYVACFRAPLPPTAEHPAMPHDYVDAPHPPYITAGRDGDAVYVMLCEGNGWRAGYSGDPFDSPWIYADSDNLPPEWREPVAAALVEIRSRWPDSPLIYRDPES